MGFIHPSGVLMLPSGLRPLGSIKTPSGWIKPIIPCDGVEQYLIIPPGNEEGAIICPVHGNYPGPRLHLFSRDSGKDAVRGPPKLPEGEAKKGGVLAHNAPPWDSHYPVKGNNTEL